MLGFDEHRWAHTCHTAGDVFVTVIVDLTPVVAQTGRSRLLDLVDGRSTAAFADWPAERTLEFRAQVQVVAIDGFTGCKNAASTAVPDAVTVVDRLHVVAPASAKLVFCQRLQQQLLGRRGRTGGHRSMIVRCVDIR